MTALAITIGTGFIVLAFVVYSVSNQHHRNQDASNRNLADLVAEFNTLKISIQRLEGLASRELQSRIDGQQAAERDRRRLADAQLRQAVADGTARVFEG